MNFLDNPIRYLLLAVFALAACAGAHASAIPKNNVWPRPTILPVPVTVENVKQPVISLRGQWKINPNPPENFWSNKVKPTDWADVKVPAQANRHIANLGGRGFGGPSATPEASPSSPDYVYKTKVNIPADFAGKRVILRFEGVTGTARVWVNGAKVGEHHGGFTPWNYDITGHFKPGQDAWLTVSILEPKRNTSTNMYNGGIIRDVKLMAVPRNHLTRFNIETDLDRDYRDATLKVWVAMVFQNAKGGRIDLTLKAPNGQKVSLNPNRIELTPEKPEMVADIPVAEPLKWDAEHPNLYTIEAQLVVNGRTVETISKSIGFRKVEVVGRKLLVNGKEVKLRGAGQFDSDALDGRALSPKAALRDVKLYKQANFNFVRPACYPPSTAFLEACDRIGLYVEGECPVTFARGAAKNKRLTPIFLSQTAETIEANRSHPSIIMWNLSNETSYGINMKKMSEYVHAEDKTRPVVFSWSHTVTPSDPLPYEIYSYHYPTPEDHLCVPGVAVFNGGRLNRQIPPMPVLADEFAHPASYNYDEMRRDPGVRNFWGESIKRFWEKMFTTEGSLGGAIWAGIDDPINEARVYPWGLLDVWRRQKPEYWLTKKAYSPVRIADKPVANPGAAQPLALPINNWFDHSNLNEVKFTWKVASESGTITGPNIEPHTSGILRLPVRQWKQGDVINLKVHAKDGMLLDEYNLPVAPAPVVLPGPQGPAPMIADNQNHITVTGKDFTFTFSKQTGLLTSGTFKGATLLKDGPYLNLIGAQLGQWIPRQVTAATDGNEAVINIAGGYCAVSEPQVRRPRRWGSGPDEGLSPTEAATPVMIEVSFEVRIDGQGLLTTKYTLDKLPINPPPTRVVPWHSTNAGGFEEVGVCYVLTGDIDRLSWKRKGLWSAYPEDHIGRNAGLAYRERKGASARPGVEPTWSWAEDEKDFNLFGPNDVGGRGTNDFRSMKENIYYASAIAAGSNARVRAESEATDAVRLEVIDALTKADVRFFINSEWNYRNLGLGNYMKEPVIIRTGYTNKVRMRLTDNDRID